MGAMLNGMALHSGLRVFGSTFFVFSDYVRPAMRMAALMQLPVTYVFTHDSIAVGEDGPTHEPIEQLASLRAMPGLTVIRPADAKETRAAWEIAATNTNGPIALVLSRQDLPVLENDQEEVDAGIEKGAYIVASTNSSKPDAIIIATGSEVSLAIEAKAELAKKISTFPLSVYPAGNASKKQPMRIKKVFYQKKSQRDLRLKPEQHLVGKNSLDREGDMLGIDRLAHLLQRKICLTLTASLLKMWRIASKL